MAQGTYFEHIRLKKEVVLEGGWNKGFSSRDISKFVVIIDGKKEKGPVISGADKAVIDGFTIIHGSLLVTGDSSMGSGIYCEKSSPVITRNIIRDNEPSGIFCSSSTARITGNEIYGNAQAGIFVRKNSVLEIHDNSLHHNKYSGVGSDKLPASKVKIRNNRIYNNGRSGINAYAFTGSISNNFIYDNNQSGIRGNLSPLDVFNNVVVRNGQGGLFIDDPEVVPDVKNNIFAWNKDAGISSGGRGYMNNLLFANGDTGACNPEYLWCVRPQFGGYEDEESYKRNRNVIADPMFADAEHNDFHLKPASPCIDAGHRDKAFNDVHFPPSMGGAINDIGAYGGPHTTAEKPKPNHAPRSDAGHDQEVHPGAKVILDGRNSTDPDGDSLSYMWTMLSTPGGSRAKLAGQTRDRAMFLADKPGTYRIQLVVKDSRGTVSKPDTVKITVPANHPPTAVIGDVLSQVSVGDTITIYGSASNDADKDPLSFKWALASKPAASHAALSGAGSKNCTLHIDVDGCYKVELTVSDGKTDSTPAAVFISTRNSVTDGIRRVPAEYPTIQSAIDAAQPGDDIIVEKGTYHELITIDKSVNLKGMDWPTIDGGKPEGNKNTVSIFYLGDRAGSLEGFIITGGGRGNLGHGINIWDSAPDIHNNRITGNNHGMGIHGSPALTGKTRVHGNLIFGNMVGIGNGKDSSARIYNNRIYDNSVVGVGARGKAAPRIEFNYIYSNRLGIGARETASPQIRGNQIFENTDGIVIGPLSTVKASPFKDIVIDNNLIVKNSHIGINITSFNLSRVIIKGNTIDSNNSSRRRLRAGGVVLGYPRPGTFKAVVERNIISNNGAAGIIRYRGTERFRKAGAAVKNDHNVMWNNTVNCLDCRQGTNDSSTALNFVSTSVPGTDAYRVSDIKTKAGYRCMEKEFADMP